MATEQTKPPAIPPLSEQEAVGRRIMQLVIATIETNNRIREAGRLLGAMTQSGGTWFGLMRNVRDHGHLTVANAARLRAQSRQHVQKLADELLAKGYARMVDNPAHKRSGLMEVTPAGERVYEEMVRRSRLFAGQLDTKIDKAELATTIAVLTRLGASLDRALANAQPVSSPDSDAELE